MPVYFDKNATTRLDPRVLEAMLPYLSGPYGNASSLHRFGRAARDAVERAREHLAVLVNCQPREIIWTSGGTESNNLALKGVTEDRKRVVDGKRVSVRVQLGGRRVCKKKINIVEHKMK